MDADRSSTGSGGGQPKFILVLNFTSNMRACSWPTILMPGAVAIFSFSHASKSSGNAVCPSCEYSSTPYAGALQSATHVGNQVRHSVYLRQEIKLRERLKLNMGYKVCDRRNQRRGGTGSQRFESCNPCRKCSWLAPLHSCSGTTLDAPAGCSAFRVVTSSSERIVRHPNHREEWH